MEREQIEKFRRHMGAGKTIKLKTVDGQEDEFYFKPLGCEFLPDIVGLSMLMEYTPEQKKIIKDLKQKGVSEDELNSKYDEFDFESNRNLMKKENFQQVVNLIDEMVKHSYPDLDPEVRSEFILSNFGALQSVLVDLHSDMGNKTVDDKIMKKIEQVKAQRRNA